MGIHLNDYRKHCVFMNSFTRPLNNSHLKCFDTRIGVLSGDDNDGYKINLDILFQINHPVTTTIKLKPQERLEIYKECYKNYTEPISYGEVDNFWRCTEIKFGGFFAALYNWSPFFLANKFDSIVQCKNETDLDDEDYLELCSLRHINDINLNYLLCLGKIAELNDGHCYFAQRGMVTLNSSYDRKIVKPIVLECIGRVIGDEVFDFKKYYHCIFNSPLFGDRCFV